MTTRIAINGFGRIGRMALRSLVESGKTDLEIVAINDLVPAKPLAHLLKYDSVQGPFPGTIEATDTHISINGKDIVVHSERNPEDLPWKALNIDIVLECSGIFLTQELAQKHINAGASRVILSAPAKDKTKTVVYGVNHETISKDDTIISNASCTTNCLSPLAKVMLETVGIKRGVMTTVHAYTQDQCILDAPHKDPYRSRAAAQNMSPTSTGAAKAVGLVLPELLGKLDGSAIRVPTPCVSMVDFAFQSEKPTDVETINAAVKAASEGDMKIVLGYTEEPLVSSDLKHDSRSSIFAAPLTKVIEGDLVKVVSWYDNEWGFASRMIDVARYMSQL